jgi:SAM-dependent methyltransferase
MSTVYDQPRLYEAAFSFRDIRREVSVMEECIRRYSRVPVSTFLELACGHGPHALEIVRKGYRYIGMDSSPAMLAYLRERSGGSKDISCRLGDLRDFQLGAEAQFAFLALGSLYVRTTSELRSHFRSVAAALPSGGLYLLDWCVYFSSIHSMHESWDVHQDALQLHVDVIGEVIDPSNQIFQERITIEGTDSDRPVSVASSEEKRLVYPQEMLLFIEHQTPFEFLGWWNEWDLNDPIPTDKAINRPITLLRKK